MKNILFWERKTQWFLWSEYNIVNKKTARILEEINIAQKSLWYKITVMNVIDRTLVEEIDCFLHSRLKDKYFNLYETCWRKIKIKENEEVFFDFLYQFLILKNNGEVFSLNLFLKKFYDCFIQIEKNNLQNMFFKQMEKYFDYF